MSNMSTHERLMQLTEFRLHLHLKLYVPPLLLLIGTVGNVLSFCVLMRKTMRVTSTYNYLAVLALVDTLVLYMGLLRQWVAQLTYVDLINQYEWSCKLINMAFYTATVSSVWLLIAVTVDRYIATVHGIHAMTMCTQRRAIRIIGGILALVTFINLHFLWSMDLKEYEDSGTRCIHAKGEGYKYLVETVWPWVDGAFYSFAPFAIIIILNTRIIIQVIRSRRKRQNAAKTNGEVTPLASHCSSENSFKVTIMLLVISFTFLLCTLPMVVVMICRAFLPENVTVQKVARHILATTIGELLMFTNHSINFYLYLLSGHRFRQELYAMLRCWCSCYGPRKSQPLYKLSYSNTLRNNSDVTSTMICTRVDCGVTVI